MIKVVNCSISDVERIANDILERYPRLRFHSMVPITKPNGENLATLIFQVKED